MEFSFVDDVNKSAKPLASLEVKDGSVADFSEGVET